MLNKNISIAIDGPAGAGKSTIAKKIAKNLSIEYIDTGAMYRALTLKVLKLNLNPKIKEDVIATLKTTTINFENNNIYLDGKMVNKEIRNTIINKNVSHIAKIKEIRETMVSLQQDLAKTKSIIMDGRDIATSVLPNADFKFFITASVEERSRRRYEELIEKGENDIYFDDIKTEIQNRDNIDSNREFSPLIQSDDAYLIDTSEMSIDEVMTKIISIVKGG